MTRVLLRLGSSALVLIGLAGCGDSPKSATRDTPTVAVEVATVEEREVPQVLELVGSLEPDERIDVSPEVGGTISEVVVDFGDRVSRGSVLLRLRDEELSLIAAARRAAVAQAEAVLDRAKLDYDRVSALDRKKIVSQEALDQAESQLRIAEANREAAEQELAIAEKRVDDTVVRSPVDGFVSRRHVSPGQHVSPNAPVYELVVSDPMEIRVDVPERLAPGVRIGTPILIRLQAFPGREFSGAITRLGAAFDRDTRTLAVEGAIPNPDGTLKPGQFARVVLDLGPEAAIIVPRAAIDTFAGTHRAFVVDATGKIEARAVSLGRDLGETIVVLDGLDGGERVAVSHLDRLTDGVRVSMSRSPR